MKNYLLNNYELSNSEAIRSIVLSEYALRHFSLAKESVTWSGRIVHALIGAVEIIPVLGCIVSVVERALANFLQKPAADLSEREIKPFHSRIHWHHACINENKIFQAGKYAQGIVKIKADDILPQDLKNDVEDILISFSCQGIDFFTQRETLSHPVFEMFLLNMPYGEEITVKFVINKKNEERVYLNEIKFAVDKVRAVYQTTKKENEFMTQSSELVEATAIASKNVAGPHAYSMGSRNINLPLTIAIKAEGGLVPAARENDGNPEEHYLIDNQSSYTNVLTFELVNNALTFNEAVVSLPIVIQAGEKKGISKEFLITSWKDAYQAATGKMLTSDAHLTLFYIQQDSYGNPFNTGVQSE